MKSSIHQFILLNFLILMFGFYGCNNEKMETPKQNTADVYVKYGVMHFKDLDVFCKTMKSIAGFDSVNLAKWKSQFIGFKSLRSMYDQISEMRDNDDTRDVEDQPLEVLSFNEGLPFIPEFSFSSVINENGVYVIGDKIHRISADRYEYIYNYDQKLLANDNNDVMLKLPEDAYTKFKIQDLLKNTETIKNGRTSWWYGSSYEWVAPYTDLGENNLHADFRVWATNYSDHASIGASITGRKYKKNCGVCKKKWQNDDMWYAQIISTPITYLSNYGFDGAAGAINEYVENKDYVYHEAIVGYGPYVNDGPIQGVTNFNIDFYYEDDGYPMKQYHRSYN